MSKAVEIFIAYARRDSAYLDELRNHLSVLTRTRRNRLDIWYDGEIKPGDVWEERIKERLHSADIILLLVSANSLASDYFYDRELADAMERHHKGEAIVAPLILLPCNWQDTDLSQLQALPKDGRPVVDWPIPDAAYTDAVASLKTLIGRIEAARREREQANKAQRQQQETKQNAELERRRQYQEALFMAATSESSGRWNEAARHLDQAMQLHREGDQPSRASLQTRLGAVSEALRKEQAYQDCMQRASQHARRKKWRPAAEAAQEALRLRPHDREAQALLRQIEQDSAPGASGIAVFWPWPLLTLLGIALIAGLLWGIIKRSKGAQVADNPDAQVWQQVNVPDPTSVPPASSPQPPSGMVRVRGGTFDMGCTPEQKDCDSDESPVTRVSVGDFFLSKYELTLREFQQFINATGYKTDADKEGSSRIWTGSIWETTSGVNWKCDVAGNIRPKSEYEHPVIHVSWNDAIDYCNWRSEKEGYTKVYTIRGSTVTANWSANGYRLPTAAEWEYAARSGGKAVLFGNGKNIANPQEINFNASASRKKDYSTSGEYRQKTVPVGSLNSPNALGLHDMSGNVWEWCWDWKGAYPGGEHNNYRGPDSGSFRVGRGGSWSGYPQIVRVANRFSNAPNFHSSILGFRLARTP